MYPEIFSFMWKMMISTGSGAGQPEMTTLPSVAAAHTSAVKRSDRKVTSWLQINRLRLAQGSDTEAALRSARLLARRAKKKDFSERRKGHAEEAARCNP